MLDKLKQLLGRSSNPTALADELIGNPVDGSSLGDGIDAIRQTQMLDDSVLAPRRDPAPDGPAITYQSIRRTKDALPMIGAPSAGRTGYVH